MSKRPLFLFCTAAVAALGCLLCITGKAFFASPALKAKPQLTEGETVYIKGKIAGIQEKEDQTVFTLKEAEIRPSEGEATEPESAGNRNRLKSLNGEKGLKSRGLLVYIRKDDGKEEETGESGNARETEACPYSIGETLLGEGKLQFIEPPGNPGEFHAENYYRAKGIDYRIFSGRITESDGKKDVYLDGLYRLSQKLKASIEQTFDEKDAGLMDSLLLGNREELDEDLYSLYQLAGIAHLLAISGLHMGLVGRGVYGLLRKCGASFLLSFLFSMLLLFSYGMLTGMGASALRAFLMFGLAMFAKVCGRPNDLLTSAALTFLLMSLENPWILTQSGVWLSFGAVFAIGGMYPTLEKFFSPSGGIQKGLLLSLSIQLFTVPVLADSYFQISVYSVFLNLLVLPLMSVVFLSGAAATFFGLFWTPLGKCAAFPAHLILKLYAFLANVFLKLPGSLFLTGKPKTGQIVLYYALLFTALFFMAQYGKKRKKNADSAHLRTDGKRTGRKATDGKSPDGGKAKMRFVKISLLFVCLLLPLVLCYREEKGLTVTMLDVGQGDGIYLKLPDGESVFLDGGSSSEKEVGAYRILPFLKAVREDSVDIWAISHGDADHYSGFLEILEEVRVGNFSIGELWLPDAANTGEGYRKVEEEAAALAIPVKKIAKGMKAEANGVTLTCLNPEAGYLSESENAYSAVLLLQYGNFSGLFTGDVEKGGEEALRAALKEAGAEDLTFLKVAHHGSANSTTEQFCEGLRVRLGFLSAGKDNSYGHPSKEVVERLEAKGTKLYSTIESGALTLHTDGKTVTIREFKR